MRQPFDSLDLDHFANGCCDNPGAVAVMEVVVWMHWWPVQSKRYQSAWSENFNLISPSSVISPPQSWVTQSSRNPRLWVCLFESFSSLVDCGIRFEVDPHWPHSGNRRRGFNTTVLSSALVSCHLHHLHRVIHAATPWPPLNIKDPGKGSHYVVGAGRRYGPCAVEGAPILRIGQLDKKMIKDLTLVG